LASLIVRACGLESGPLAAHSRGMVEKFRTNLLEVSVTPFTPRKWGWRVSSGEEVVAEGFEDGRIEARFEGYNAMFQLLAAGWTP
jgi:hypothetical protein